VKKLILCLLMVAFLRLCATGFCQSLFATLSPAASSSNTEAVVRFENTTGTFGTEPDALDVDFQFLTPAPVVGTRRIPARLTLHARAGGLFAGGAQPLCGFEFTIRPRSPKDVYGNGILLRSVPPDENVLALADLFQVGSRGTLSSDFALGLVMQSDYLPLDSHAWQSSTWMFLEPLEGGDLIAGANGWLRDTRLGRQIQGSFIGTIVAPEKPEQGK
jgi:hypothetical protein